MLSKNLLSEIKEKSDLLDSLKPLSSENQAKLDKKFRLEFNFNSNHLEGNTLTYGETKLLLMFEHKKGDHEDREYEEMLAHDVALKMILEDSKDKERVLTEKSIKEINEILLVKPYWKDALTEDHKPVRKPIIPGQYKTMPNSVKLSNGETYSYTAPENVSKEMHDLIEWYNKNEELENPVIMAALLHYRYVRIHPFDDGNGRTARLLMNYVLLRHSLPLIVIKSADKETGYLRALRLADIGKHEAFVEYIGTQLLWSLDLSIKAAKGEKIEEEDDLDKEIELLNRKLKNKVQ